MKQTLISWSGTFSSLEEFYLKKNRLKNKATKQKNALDINEIINPSSTHHEGGRSSLSTKRGANSSNKMADFKNVMVDYLRRLIIRLENQQAAESIKYVIDCKKPERAGGQYQFCVIFDEALSHNECWMNESNLDLLDKLREQSLFKPYKIPQKLYHSVNSANVILTNFTFVNLSKLAAGISRM